VRRRQEMVWAENSFNGFSDEGMVMLARDWPREN